MNIEFLLIYSFRLILKKIGLIFVDAKCTISYTCRMYCILLNYLLENVFKKKYISYDILSKRFYLDQKEISQNRKFSVTFFHGSF